MYTTVLYSPQRRVWYSMHLFLSHYSNETTARFLYRTARYSTHVGDDSLPSRSPPLSHFNWGAFFLSAVALRSEGPRRQTEPDAKPSCRARPSRAHYSTLLSNIVTSTPLLVLSSLSSRTHPHGPAMRHHLSFLSCDK
jgi:hypothetical protein